jgi:hypothetical protein
MRSYSHFLTVCLTLSEILLMSGADFDLRSYSFLSISSIFFHLLLTPYISS